MYNYDNEEDDYSYLNQNFEETIDANDLNIIDDPLNWEPTEEYVLAYANHLGLDISNDPPELFNIIKKYLLKPLPANYLRAFTKDDYRIVYIDDIKNEVHLDNELDLECKNEYEMMKKKLMEKKEIKKKKSKKDGKSSSKSKSKKKKKKKSSKNSSERVSNEEDEKDINLKKEFNLEKTDEKSRKINLLKKKKEKYHHYKDKCKNSYINNKKDIRQSLKEKYDKKIILQKRALKDDLEKHKIKDLEEEFENEYNQNIKIYKNEIEKNLEKEKLNNPEKNKFIEEKNELQQKKREIQDEILKQKEKNKQKLEELRKKAQNEIESIINKKKEEQKNKYSLLVEKNNKKIYIIEKEFEIGYEKYINQFKMNNNKRYYNDNNEEKNKIKNKNDMELKEYLKEIKEQYDKRKNEIKDELENEHLKELKDYEKNIIHINNNKSNEFKDDILNIEKKYYDEIEVIKSQNISNNNQIEEINTNKNNLNSKYNIEKMHKGIDDLINDIIYDMDSENLEESIKNQYNEIFLKLNQIKSLFDLSEKQYTMKYFNIEYYKDLIMLITKKLVEKNPFDNLIIDNENFQNIKSKDTSLVNELILNCRELINKYSDKFEKEKKKKLFEYLEDKFKKICEKQKLNNYNNAKNEKSLYEQSSKNAINTTILLGDIKNMLFKNNNNNLNKTNNYIMLNNTINEKSNNKRDKNLNNISLSANKNKNIFRNSNNIQINNLFSSPSSEKSSKLTKKINDIIPNSINLSSSLQFDNQSKKNNKNLYNIRNNYKNSYRNKIISNNSIINENKKEKTNKNEYIHNSGKINNIIYDNKISKNNIEENNIVNYEFIELPKLIDNIKNDLSDDNINLYNIIIDLLSNEYESLNIKINNAKKASNNIKKQLYDIKESIYFIKYKNIFTNIYNKENERSQEIFDNILIEKNKLDKIKNECDILFNNINLKLLNSENINEKFKDLLEKIEIYKNMKNKNNNENKDINKSINNLNNNINSNKDLNNQLGKSKIIENNYLIEDKSNIRSNSNFIDFYNSYNPSKLSRKINNTFTHTFFNFKNHNEDIKYNILTSEVI